MKTSSRKLCSRRWFAAVLIGLFALHWMGERAANAQTNCAVPPSGLVAWWAGEGNANDSLGVMDGAPLLIGYGPGKVGKAFVFDGITSGVLLGNQTSLQLQNLTIETWIRRSSVSQASLAGG